MLVEHGELANIGSIAIVHLHVAINVHLHVAINAQLPICASILSYSLDRLVLYIVQWHS